VDRRARQFLAEECDAFRPFDALDDLSDEELDRPIPAAHDWSGRDLIAHLVAWLGDAVDAARELAVYEESEAIERSRREFAARGDEVNAEIQATWRVLPLAEVRRRLHETPAELREALAVAPESRWIDNADQLRFFRVYTIVHYADHYPELDAIVGAAS
jgi:hypothetical protein